MYRNPSPGLSRKKIRFLGLSSCRPDKANTAARVTIGTKRRKSHICGSVSHPKLKTGTSSTRVFGVPVTVCSLKGV